MSKVKALLTLLFSAIGVFAAREFYKPRNIKDLLKWRGVRLAIDKLAWDSMFFENQKELEEMNIDNSDALWSWCNGRFKQNNLNDENELTITKKFCSDNPKSIMARIIRVGEAEKVIKQDDNDAFAINYQLSKDRQEVLKLIDYPVEGTSYPKPLEVSKVLSQWCEKQKRTSINSQDDKAKMVTFKTRCYNRGVKTVSELLKKEGKTPLSGTAKYKSRFESGKFQYVKQLMDEIKKSLENNETKKNELTKLLNTSPEIRNIEQIDENPSFEKLVEKYGWMLYKSWCEDKLVKPLLTNEMHPQTYKKVSFRCTEKGAN